MALSVKRSRSSRHILIASGNPGFQAKMARLLGTAPWKVSEAVGGAEALVRLEETDAGILLLDRHIDDLDYSELMSLIPSQYPDVEVALLDGDNGEVVFPECPSPDSQLRDVYVVLQLQEPYDEELPVDPDALATPQLIASAEALPGMLGSSPALQCVFRLARLVARRDTTVLITGQTGTGKELVARGIHQLSSRAKGPLVVVNCAAIPETLLESELFGCVRGAYTGAVEPRLGRIHAAHGGTLFLDEVGELPLSMQAKLLRFLQEGEVQRLGSSDVFRVDVRVVAATNLDLEERVRLGAIRQDLFFRLAVFPIELPPLRNHVQDIEDLARYHLAALCQRAGVPVKGMSVAAVRLLRRHSWPGNVRELQHAVERAFILSEDQPRLLPEHFSLGPRPAGLRKF